MMDQNVTTQNDKLGVTHADRCTAVRSFRKTSEITSPSSAVDT